MNISVIGAGYLGLPVGIAFAMHGNDVTFVDKDPDKVTAINSYQSYVTESGVQEQLDKPEIQQKIRATSDVELAINETDIGFMVVDTPAGKSTPYDLNNVLAASENVGQALKKRKNGFTFVVKSTVAPGVVSNQIIPTVEKSSGKTQGKEFNVVYNPSFTNEGNALEDILYRSPIIIGSTEQDISENLDRAYAGFQNKVYHKLLVDVELFKMATNLAQAQAISFANEMGTLARAVGAESDGLFEIVRSVYPFADINPGLGFGGSCLPKEMTAAKKLCEQYDISSPLLDSVSKVNDNQPGQFIDLYERFSNSKKVTLLGIAFKADIDDPRDSQTFPLVTELVNRNYEVLVHDPQKKCTRALTDRFNEVSVTQDLDAAMNFSDSILIATNHKEYANPEMYAGKIVIDGRRSVQPNETFEYHKF